MLGLGRALGETIAVMLGAIALSAGVAGFLKLSPLIVCFVAGLLLANLPGAWKEEVKQALWRLERPLYLIFLVIVAGLTALATIPLAAQAATTPIFDIQGSGAVSPLAGQSVTTSGVGVMIADRMNEPRIANFHPRIRKPGVTSPSRASTKMTTGIWKTSPSPSRNHE